MSRTVVLCFAIIALFGVVVCGADQKAGANVFNAKAMERAKKLVSQMTLKEKCEMLSGYRIFFIRGNERLGIPFMKTAGGLGCKFDKSQRCYDHPGASVSYPASIALNAAWDRHMAAEYGTAHAKDCRARGVDILLGPGVNICRTPECGRNFEYYSEDPYLASEMVVPYTKAVQKAGVMTSVKHYACNNMDWERFMYDAIVDERTLREIYLPVFKAAVIRGGAWTVMTAYNKINGEYGSENRHLLLDILKGEWGFKGFVMSDWGGTHSTVGSLTNGLDLEMPSNSKRKFDKVKKALDEGKVTMKQIDGALTRILYASISIGVFERKREDSSITLDPPENEEISTQLAREGTVLLKNENGFLPVDPAKIKKIAVVGRLATKTPTGGAGSSYIVPTHRISILDGLKARFKNAKFVLVNPHIPSVRVKLKQELFNNANCEGAPVDVKENQMPRVAWRGKAPVKKITVRNYSARWSGEFTVPVSGKYELRLSGRNMVRVFIDGKLVMDKWYNKQGLQFDYGVMQEFTAGRKYKLKIDLSRVNNKVLFRLAIPCHASKYERERELVKDADLVVGVAGFSAHTEGEGRDRTFALPDDAGRVLEAVAESNPNTVVILIGGGAMDMLPWVDKVKGVFMAWYPGQNGGTALAELLTGVVSPSGKLPVTFAKKFEDYTSSKYLRGPKSDPLHVEYKDGIFVGYRGFDQYKIEPLFPFGFGLTYTTFKYSNLKLAKSGGVVKVRFDLTNTGHRKAAEIAQVYVHDVKSSVPRPPKELKGFERIELKPGETKNVSIDVPTSSLAFYDVKSKSWKLEPGKFEFMVGASSRDIKLKDSIDVAR